MFRLARDPRAIWIASCFLVLAVRCPAGTPPAASADHVGSWETGALTLTLAARSVAQPVVPELGDPAAQKFVKIAIADVRNPKRIRLSFDVAYQPRNGDKVPLGTFSLYPPDRPGTFLVATRGLVRDEGAIVVTMRVLDPVGPDDEVRVRIDRISLANS